MRTFDARFLNEVANHPEVRPTLFGEGEIDLSPLLSSASNFAQVNEHGGFLAVPNAPGIYEVHTIFLPGSNPLDFMAECQEWMFTRTDCQKLTSKVPKSNRAAKGFALKSGMTTVFENNTALFGPCEFVELDILKWAMRTDSLLTHGERFHAVLKAAKEAHGSQLPEHPDDPAHEKAVGAAMLMIERGQPIKGVEFYNRWANLAGYSAIKLLSLIPVTIDVGDAIIGPDMEVQLCR